MKKLRTKVNVCINFCILILLVILPACFLFIIASMSSSPPEDTPSTFSFQEALDDQKPTQSLFSMTYVSPTMKSHDCSRASALFTVEHLVQTVIEEENALYEEARTSGNIEDYVILVANSYGIRPELVSAVIQVESRWKPEATNGPHIGLMQINQYIHAGRMEKLGVTDLFNPFDNVLVGTDLLAELISVYNDEGAALVAYNSGSYNGYYTNYALTVLDIANN